MARNEDKGWILTALEQHERALVAYARRITGDLERARDVVQEVFLRLCQQDREGVEGHVAEWLYTACRRRALDVRVKESPMKIASTEVGNERMEEAPDVARDPAGLAERRDEHRRILGFVERLPEKQREVLRLKFQQGLSYVEIAGVTETSVGNVGYLLHHGLKNLKQLLGVEGAVGATEEVQ